jgi:hypothetical protein
MGTKTFCPNFIREIFETEEFPGLYVFLSPYMDVLYVGRSTELPKRVKPSLKRKEIEIQQENHSCRIAYVSTAKVQTLSDLSVYEKIYISYLKPILNKHEKFDDTLTLDFPHLLFCTPIQIYEEYDLPMRNVWNPEEDLESNIVPEDVWPEEFLDGRLDAPEGSLFSANFLEYNQKAKLYFEGLTEDNMSDEEKHYRHIARKKKKRSLII